MSQAMRFERHNVERQVCIIPLGVLRTHPEHWPEAPKVPEHARHEQRTVSFAREGELAGDTTAFSAEDLMWAREESARCWEAALREPLFMAAYYY